MLLLAGLFLLGLALLSSGCGGQSPTDVAKDFSQKINNRQFGDIYDGLAAESPIRNEISRDDWITLNESTFPDGLELADFQVTDEKVDGDRAMVLWSATAKAPSRADEPTNGTLAMVKENDVWKIEQ